MSYFKATTTVVGSFKESWLLAWANLRLGQRERDSFGRGATCSSKLPLVVIVVVSSPADTCSMSSTLAF